MQQWERLKVSGLVYVVHLAHPVLLDVLVIQDKGLQDLLDSQVMEYLDLKERRETQATRPALELFTAGHLDHLDLQGLREQQDQEGTKVNQASRVHQESQGSQELLQKECLTMADMASLDLQVHQDLLDFQGCKESKGNLDFLVLLEAPSRSPPALLALQVPQGLQEQLLLPLKSSSTFPATLPEAGWSEAQVLLVHPGLRESLEPSPAHWKTSQLESLHTSSVLALVSALVSRVLQDHLVLLVLVLDP